MTITLVILPNPVNQLSPPPTVTPFTELVGADRVGYEWSQSSVSMPSTESTPPQTEPLASRGYEITVDDGRESFFALQIEDPDDEDAWLMSDVVRSLEEMR